MRKAVYVLCGVTLPCAALHAANLLQNPDFDQGLTAWDTHSSTTTVVNDDGSPSAPAAQFSTSPLSGTLFVTQCVSLAGSPPPWEFGIRVRVVSSVGNSCQINVYSAFDTGTCTLHGGNYGAGADAGGTVPGAQGNFIQYAGLATDPMPGVIHSQSAQFTVLVDCPNGGGDAMTINVDHAYLGTAGTTPVRLQSFEVR